MKKIIDLTHTLSSTIPSWDSNCSFVLETLVDYKDCVEPNLFRSQKIETNAGQGTHMDAPAHVVPGGKTIEQLEIENLITECVVIDVSTEADENYLAMPAAVERFEKEHGPIPRNAFVIFRTGWADKYWSIPEKYNNNLKFPGVHESTAKLLLQRDIAGLGIDTLSADAGGKDFPVHRAILGAGKYLVENVANTKELPPTGAKVWVMPLKMKGATESPIRLIATVEE